MQTKPMVRHAFRATKSLHPRACPVGLSCHLRSCPRPTWQPIAPSAHAGEPTTSSACMRLEPPLGRCSSATWCRSHPLCGTACTTFNSQARGALLSQPFTFPLMPCCAQPTTGAGYKYDRPMSR